MPVQFPKTLPRSLLRRFPADTEAIMQIAIGIILIISAIFLIVAVLMQHGKSHNLSGTIAGGAETFFGKTKGSRYDKILSRLTTVIGVVFTVLCVVLYIVVA